ncbi:MAG TPA: 4a-hydroxytetrahydrobiopterin dehydratase [Mycobacteriales bacterium]|nr:4a-hydroxytetrahydrobiopterin dehydratase [Mycobacteriales bacterium]
MTTLLDDTLVHDALQGLDGWDGDHERISRTVTVDADQVELLLSSVQEAADAMNHHPAVERTDTGVRFVNWTHSAGGVTELDIALASRIDDALRRVTGEPPPPVHPDAAVGSASKESAKVPGGAANTDTGGPVMGTGTRAEGGTSPVLPSAEPGSAERDAELPSAQRTTEVD